MPFEGGRSLREDESSPRSINEKSGAALAAGVIFMVVSCESLLMDLFMSGFSITAFAEQKPMQSNSRAARERRKAEVGGACGRQTPAVVLRDPVGKNGRLHRVETRLKRVEKSARKGARRRAVGTSF